MLVTSKGIISWTIINSTDLTGKLRLEEWILKDNWSIVDKWKKDHE